MKGGQKPKGIIDVLFVIKKSPKVENIANNVLRGATAKELRRSALIVVKHSPFSRAHKEMEGDYSAVGFAEVGAILKREILIGRVVANSWLG